MNYLNLKLDTEHLSKSVFLITILFILLISLGLRILYIQSTPLSNDETHNLMFAVLSMEYKPYKEVFVGIAPFALLIVQLGVKIWNTALGVRYPMVLFSLLSIISIFFLVAKKQNLNFLLAGTFAALFFSFNPHFFLVSSSINLEAGALAFALVSVALAELYCANDKLIWLFLSGIGFALSLAIKIFVPFVPLVVATQILLNLKFNKNLSFTNQKTYIHLLKLGLIWGSGVLLVLGLSLVVYDPQMMYEQVINFRLRLREVTITSLGDVQVATELSWNDIVQYIPLLIGSIISLLFTRRQTLPTIVVWVVWFILSFIFINAHIPLRPRHTVIILPPLAAVSGLGMAYLITFLDRQKKLFLLNPFILLITLGWIFYFPLQAITAEKEDYADQHLPRQIAINYIKENTMPTDCVITKENRINFLANRLTPPYLSEISTARIFSGLLSADEIITGADASDCPILVYSSSFDELIPELAQKAQALYSLQLEIKEPNKSYNMILYTVKMNTQQPPPYPVNGSFDNLTMLKGYDIFPHTWITSEPVIISTYWQAMQNIEQDYKIFLHLTDQEGNVVQAFDHYPFEIKQEYLISDIKLNPKYLDNQSSEAISDYPGKGLLPTHLWIPHNTLKETITIDPSDDISPGEYFLYIGMYNEETMKRLSVSDDLPDSEHDQILLTTIQIR